jgi:hypothetical protein
MNRHVCCVVDLALRTMAKTSISRAVPTRSSGRGRSSPSSACQAGVTCYRVLDFGESEAVITLGRRAEQIRHQRAIA